MAQVTETVARGILAGHGYTDNEVRQLAHHWLASHEQAPAQTAPAAVAEPVAWLHDDPQRYDVIHAEVKDVLVKSRDAAGHLHRPLDKSAHYTIPLYAAPAPSAQGDALDAAFEAVRQRLCELQRYSFVLDDDGVVRRVKYRFGNWIEFDDAHALFDPVAVDAARAQAKEGASHE